MYIKQTNLNGGKKIQHENYQEHAELIQMNESGSLKRRTDMTHVSHTEQFRMCLAFAAVTSEKKRFSTSHSDKHTLKYPELWKCRNGFSEAKICNVRDDLNLISIYK